MNSIIKRKEIDMEKKRKINFVYDLETAGLGKKYEDKTFDNFFNLFSDTFSKFKTLTKPDLHNFKISQVKGRKGGKKGFKNKGIKKKF